jgi:hypothetical protein
MFYVHLIWITEGTNDSSSVIPYTQNYRFKMNNQLLITDDREARQLNDAGDVESDEKKHRTRRFRDDDDDDSIEKTVERNSVSCLNLTH